MMNIVPIPAFRDNYIWAICHGDQVAVVDPGDAQPVIDFLAGRTLAAILVTHHHQDHVGGIDALCRHYVPTVFAPTVFAPTVFGPAGESITGLTRSFSGGESFTLPGFGIDFSVLAVPGHTRGHIAYAAPGVLFCGDTLFGAGCGRLFEGTAAQMFDSLAAIAVLPPATRVYCAHEYTAQNLRFAVLVEPDSKSLAERIARVADLRARGIPSVPSTLAEELATNPFLRCREAAVHTAVAQRATDASPQAVFAALRAWRDEF